MCCEWHHVLQSKHCACFYFEKGIKLKEVLLCKYSRCRVVSVRRSVSGRSLSAHLDDEADSDGRAIEPQLKSLHSRNLLSVFPSQE